MARQNMELLLSDEAVELLIDKGYNPDFGARPLRRAIERYIEDPLSEDMLAGKIVGGTVYVDTEDDELTFENRQPTAELPHEEPTPASSS